jgi:uncharacterized protein (TIGR02145 family)
MKTIRNKRIFPFLMMGILLLLLSSCKKDDNNNTGESGNTTNITMTDIDGNVYHAVKIGDQVWTVENLKVTRYRNGDAVPNITDDSQWESLTTGAYCNYVNNPNNAAVYGRLYNFYAVIDSRNIAPQGWHIPTDAEWTTLTTVLGGDGVAGGKMKEPGTTHWNSPNTGADNSSGFTGLGAGYRFNFGLFKYILISEFFWTITEKDAGNAWTRYLYSESAGIQKLGREKNDGYSIRLIKD